MFDTVLIANRGAIATRIIRTLKTMGIRAVSVYHKADANSLHVQRADEAICLGEGSAADTYLNIDKIIDAAKKSGAKAIHPGYGFLSENTLFVERCEKEGIAFIGPTPEQINLFGLKHEARDTAAKAGVPLVPGSPLLSDQQSAAKWANDIGYPVMLKSTAGGGGIGMQVCESEAALLNAWESVKRLSANYFANDGVFLEKFIRHARHIEVQVFGDGAGNVVSFGERDCSAQRRNQKVIEETPAPRLDNEKRTSLHQTAEKLMASVNYRNAGTVEFIYDDDSGEFYFLEVNTRLQVEHGVTEEVWSVDLVKWMVSLAAGELSDINALKKNLAPSGHAIQVRVYAEDPQENFRPSAGLLSEAIFPEAKNLRVDTWVESGLEVPALFDPMIAKVISYRKSRQQALDALADALDNSSLYGIETNLDYLRQLIGSELCQDARLLTNSLANFNVTAATLSVLQAGTQTTIQDYPGRSGYWDVGVPPSGPMDNLSFRQANALLKNNIAAAGLEITLNGPTLRFNHDTVIVICGARIDALLDGQPLAMATPIKVTAGQVLKLGKVLDEGARSYLAVADGLQCPNYLDTKSTFTLGQFGGHNGRALQAGDVLRIKPASRDLDSLPHAQHLPAIGDHWQLRVIYGPHGAPDFFTEDDIDTFFKHTWEVHYNSSRTGVRLIGPKPTWARETGGEAGLHPSNIHDNAYAFGSVDFTGDMPVILGPDGPSLGGFVCPVTVITADLWKLGQLKAGAKVSFIPVSIEDAVRAEKAQNESVNEGQAVEYSLNETSLSSPVVHESTLLEEKLVYRTAGDHFLLVELGPLELDIARRLKIHALMLWLQENPLPGLRELTPGIRSLQIHYDSQTVTLQTIIQHLEQADATLSQREQLKVPTRTVYLPLSWDDEACRKAIEKYTQSVRPGAPWCPSNLEFIRRINGLEDIQAVKELVFNAAYLVMGLGDVYLGAPVATPVDPRHRLVTTKYNPARTWTAENSVGIGGAYLCIYGMEGPGGYQFVGRTIQMWNRYRRSDVFNKPWLLRFFDQVRFYEVSHDELVKFRQDFPLGRYPLKIEHGEFSLEGYESFIKQNQEEIDQFKTRRSKAFNEELDRWRKDGQLTFEQQETQRSEEDNNAVPEHVTVIESPVSGSVWQIETQEGEKVEEGETLMILESMKMEIEITAPCSGIVTSIKQRNGNGIQTGQTLLWITPHERDA